MTPSQCRILTGERVAQVQTQSAGQRGTKSFHSNLVSLHLSWAYQINLCTVKTKKNFIILNIVREHGPQNWKAEDTTVQVLTDYHWLY